MANNVYIGSRYVPIFDGDWVNNKTYESLTIVTYGNNSYTSKVPVPLNTPPTTGDANDPYWALTGNYNGQISNLQSQINTLNDKKLTNMTDRYYLFLGDSYDSDTSISPNGWISPLCIYAGITNYKKLSGGSYGFVGYISGYTWLSKCQTLTTAEKQAITDVFIGGCAADWNASTADIEQAMANLDSWFRSNLPNLKTVSVAFLEYNYSTDMSKVSSQADHYDRIRHKSHELGWFFVAGSNLILADPRCHTGASDWLHPNARGVERISNYLVDALHYSHINMQENYTMVFTVDSTSSDHKFASTGTKSVYCSICDGVFTMEFTNNFNLTITTAFSSQTDVSLGNTDLEMPIIRHRFVVPMYVLVGSTMIPTFAELYFDTRSHLMINIATSSSNLAVNNHIVIPRFTATWALNSIGR